MVGDIYPTSLVATFKRRRPHALSVALAPEVRKLMVEWEPGSICSLSRLLPHDDVLPVEG
jgi:hypothetical protein